MRTSMCSGASAAAMLRRATPGIVVGGAANTSPFGIVRSLSKPVLKKRQLPESFGVSVHVTRRSTAATSAGAPVSTAYSPLMTSLPGAEASITMTGVVGGARPVAESAAYDTQHSRRPG